MKRWITAHFAISSSPRALLYAAAISIVLSSVVHPPVSAFESSLLYRNNNDVLYTNPDAIVCGANTGTAIAIDSAQAAEAIFKFFISTNFTHNGNKPLTGLQAAAFMGNFYQESRYNPATIQSGKKYDEAKALSPGVGGYALGLVQWDTGRRVELVKFAKEKNKDWKDITLQFEFIKHELDGSEQRILNDATFQSSGDVADVTIAVRKIYERPGDPHDEVRIKAAKDALDKYGKLAPSVTTLSSSSSDSSTTECEGGMQEGNGDIAAAATKFSWPKRYDAGARDHQPLEANPAYKEAIAKVGIDKCSDPSQKIGASCDAFLATVIRFTGIDKDFPCGSSGTQDAYMRSHTDTFTYIGTYSRGQEKEAMTKMQAGDLMARVGHVSIYLGDGREADASIGQRTAEQAALLFDGTYNVYRAKKVGASSL